MISASCAKCSASFEYESPRAGRPRKYCDNCRRIDARRRHEPRPKREVTCETCGKTAFTHAPKWRFCSRKCKDDHWGKTLSCSKCGATMWRGGRSAETLICRDCRRIAGPKHGKASSYKRGCRCDECRQAWNEQCRRNQSAARARAGKSSRVCVVCSMDFAPRSNQVTCSPACRKVHLGRLGDHSSRAAYYGVEYEIIDRFAVFERDAWVCGICELPVGREASWPDPGAPTLDHVVPMSQGGGHVLANVQLAHFYCNTVKGNRMEQAC